MSFFRHGAILLLFSACKPFAAQVPDTFAGFEDNTRAVHSSGVVYRVRAVPHEPEAPLPFWKEALKVRMLDSGYTFVEEGDLKKAALPGAWLEVATAVGQQDHAYLMAVFVHDSHLVIAEAAGEVSALRAQRDNIFTAMRHIEFK